MITVIVVRNDPTSLKTPIITRVTELFMHINSPPTEINTITLATLKGSNRPNGCTEKKAAVEPTREQAPATVTFNKSSWDRS